MTTPHQPQPHTDGMPDDIRITASEIVADWFMNGANRPFVDELAKAILSERRRIASDLFNRPGFMTNNSADGKHWIEISFKTGDESWGLYSALCNLSQWKLPSTTQSQTGRQSDD